MTTLTHHFTWINFHTSPDFLIQVQSQVYKPCRWPCLQYQYLQFMAVSRMEMLTNGVPFHQSFSLVYPTIFQWNGDHGLPLCLSGLFVTWYAIQYSCFIVVYCSSGLIHSSEVIQPFFRSPVFVCNLFTCHQILCVIREYPKNLYLWETNLMREWFLFPNYSDEPKWGFTSFSCTVCKLL